MKLTRYTALALLITGCAVSPPDESIREGALDLEQTQTTVSGSYARAGSLIEFSARTSGATTSVHLDVNGLAFDVTLNAATQTVRHDGRSGAIFIEDREALTAMAEALHDQLSLTRETPMQEQMLVRTVSYLSEVPPGYTLAARELVAPNVVDADREKIPRAGARLWEDQPDGSEAFIGMADGHGNTITDPGEVAELEVNQACQQNGEDGIKYLTSSTKVSKSTTWSRYAEHDCQSHCFGGKYVTAGPGAYKCKGECGPGCYGSGVYSYDCLDHDQCCREGYNCANPSDASCGDEFWEADDDFWNGRILWLY